MMLLYFGLNMQLELGMQISLQFPELFGVVLRHDACMGRVQLHCETREEPDRCVPATSLVTVQAWPV